MYEVTRSDGSKRFRTDLYSRCQIGAGVTKPSGAYTGLVSELDGVISCSVVIDPELVAAEFEENPRVWPERRFIPQVEFWQDEFTDLRLPRSPQELIIYELHIGALGFDRKDSEGRPLPGTLADAIEFLDHVVGSGANAIELLPMSEFGESTVGWGYSTSHYFAVEFSGGGRDQYKHFIKAAHRRGLAVILDVVYNHYAHEAERAQRNYDSPREDHDSYYWYEGIPEQYDNPRGGYVENYSTGDAPAYHEEMVRKLFISSAVALMQEFHVDGFRVDQTTSIHAMNKRRADGQPVPDANIYGAKLLREFSRTLRILNPGVLLIAEDHSDWSEVTRSLSEGGMGFDLRWGAEFYHHLIGDTARGSDTAKLIWTAAARAFEHPPLAMKEFAKQMTNSQYKRVVYSESHDEAGNSTGPFVDPAWNGDEGKQSTSHRTLVVASNGAYLSPEVRRFAEARCRFAYGMTVLSAGTPMYLFGEEVGAEKRYKYHGVITQREDYQGMRQDAGKWLYAFYHDVNLFRRSHLGLQSANVDCLHADDEGRVLAFRRWCDREEFLVIGSLRDQPVAGFELRSERLSDGHWREVFNSDSWVYGGANVGNLGALIRSSSGALRCVLPANGVLVFRRN
jgi:1,4-alpha-glucan branching enzyme